MSERLLLVTQSTRSYGEFRRPWVRRLDRRYVAAHRRWTARVARALAARGPLTVLAARELVDEAALPSGTRVRWYDEQALRTDTGTLAALARQLEGRAWPAPDAAPALVHRGVWLPEVLTFNRRLLLRLEIAEPVGAVGAVWDEAKPDRLVVLTGASPPERIAARFARRDGRPVETAAPGFLAARLYARAQAALFPREERLRVRAFLAWPRRPAGPPPPAAGPRILLATCRPRQHLLVDPLVEALRQAGAACHVAVLPIPELRAATERLDRAGVPWSWLSDDLPAAEGRALVRRLAPDLARAWRRVRRDPAVAAGCAWQGLDLAPVARPFLRDAVTLGLRAAAVFQEAAMRALDRLRPDAVIVTNVRRHAERALLLAARARGVPALVFSNAFVMVREREDIFNLGDRLLVIGEHVKQRLCAEQGLPPARITVIGDPRSNAARLLPRAALRAETLAAFGLADDRPLVTVVSKYVSLLFSIEEKAAFYRAVFGARRRLGDPHVIVKVHPNEDLGRLREQVREWGCPEARLTQDHDIHRLFAASDAAVMVTSMAGLEAMAMGCPVVAVQTAGKDFEGGGMPSYVGAGVVERVDLALDAPETTAVSLAAALRRLLADPAARAERVARGRAFAAPHLHPVDGRLGARLLDVIAEVRGERAAPAAAGGGGR
jgi:hypothetical protein